MNSYMITSELGMRVVESHDIFRAAVDVKQEALSHAKRGYKVTIRYNTTDCASTGSTHCDGQHLIADVVLRDTKGREYLAWQVYEEMPAKAHNVRNPWDNSLISCRFTDGTTEECGSQMFYGIGRSLDLHDWKCASCGNISHTMTETGMSA